MAIKVELGDETTMNMTPMIDITFNLVIFFMLTLDLSSKEYLPLTLPFAYHGVEDKDDTSDPIQALKVVVNVLPDGKMVLKGLPWDLSTKDVKEQTAALRALHRELLDVTSPTGGLNTREPDGHSKIALQIHADRDAMWRYVQWVMGVASSKQTKIYKIYFSVKQPAPEESSAP